MKESSGDMTPKEKQSSSVSPLIEEELGGEKDWKAPIPQLEGSFPVVLYFANEADRTEFIEEVKRAKPNMKAVPL